MPILLCCIWVEKQSGKLQRAPIKAIIFYVYKAYVFAEGMFKMSRKVLEDEKYTKRWFQFFFSYNYRSQSITNLYAVKPFSYVLIYRMDIRTYSLGTSLLVQWLRIYAPSVGGLGLVLGLGTRSHMPQLRVYMLQLKSLLAAMMIKDPAFQD